AVGVTDQRALGELADGVRIRGGDSDHRRVEWRVGDLATRYEEARALGQAREVADHLTRVETHDRDASAGDLTAPWRPTAHVRTTRQCNVAAIVVRREERGADRAGARTVLLRRTVDAARKNRDAELAGAAAVARIETERRDGRRARLTTEE